MSLKLEAQRVKETGYFDSWQKWKSRTKCAFDGSGYEKVISNKLYAETNEHMNRVVCAQLYVAMVDGTAHHLVQQHETEKMDMLLGSHCAIGLTETSLRMKQQKHFV
jgi:hypothetical protein